MKVVASSALCIHVPDAEDDLGVWDTNRAAQNCFARQFQEPVLDQSQGKS